MNHDAFSAGVEPGGLYSSQEIKILICYMLAGVDEPLPRQSVLEIIATGGMALLVSGETDIDVLDGVLTLKGLRILYEKNK